MNGELMVPQPLLPSLAPAVSRPIRPGAQRALWLLTVLLVLLLASVPAALAASLQFDVDTRLPPARGQDTMLAALQGGVQLADLPLQGGRASVGVAWSQGLSASLYLRQTTTLGPVGNVILELQAGGSTSGQYRAQFTARGVAGPVAARLRLSAANDGDLLLAGPASSVFPAEPNFTGARTGLQLGATWRPTATLLLDLNAGMFSTPATAYTLSGEARLLRQSAGHDLILGFDGYLQTGMGATGFGAVRVGRQFNQRRAAPWQVSLLFGAGPAYVGPGLRVSGAQQFGQAELKITAAAEFYRSDVAPLQLAVQWQQPLSGPVEPDRLLTVSTMFDWNAATGSAGRVQLSYRVPLGW